MHYLLSSFFHKVPIYQHLLIISFFNLLPSSEQHDAHEFLCKLLDELQIEFEEHNNRLLPPEEGGNDLPTDDFFLRDRTIRTCNSCKIQRYDTALLAR